jgi:hypothetical protein
MSRKLGTGKTKTFSVCLPEETYDVVKAIADKFPRESVGSVVRRCLDALVECVQEGEDMKPDPRKVRP